MTKHYDNYDLIAKDIVERVGKKVVMAIPLGIGKPIGLTNALYRLACEDKSINLTILTALTLARPVLHNELEKRFIEPILERTLKDYEDPLYERARQLQQLPDNINVIEFFFAPGAYINNSSVQQQYLCAKYTSAVQDGINYGINVFAQQVAYSPATPNQYSLSCNSDIFQDVVNRLNEFMAAGKKVAIVAEVNLNLPYMTGDALINEDTFTDIVDVGHYHALFAIPSDEISVSDHMIGLYTACLIPDDSCLEIGIGKLSNAVADAVILRQKNNAVFQETLKKLSANEKFGDIISAVGATAGFDKGVYASTEMLSDEFMHMYAAGILKKRVYDHIGLQRLLNSQMITENVTPKTIEVLLENKIINPVLTADDFQFLQKFGIFNANVSYQDGTLVLASGEKITPDLSTSMLIIFDKCLGKQLKTGKILHGGFFLGNGDFYQALRDLSPEELQLFDMTSIIRTNSLHWNYELLQLQRKNARLINSAMMVTLGGGVVSDGLKDLQEFSGVGGQFDFVNMAQELKGARSIINCRSTRKSKDGVQSNIVWDYPTLTIPRYLRDIVVTEYGIADCRSKVDSEVIKAMLNVADSRFQQQLLNQAKKCGKISQDYTIPKMFQNNLPSSINPVILNLQSKGFCKPYPFGSELTEEEQVLKRVLLSLKNSSKTKLLLLMFGSLFYFSGDEKYSRYLSRMKLEKPQNIQDYMYKKLFKYVLRKH